MTRNCLKFPEWCIETLKLPEQGPSCCAKLASSYLKWPEKGQVVGTNISQNCLQKAHLITQKRVGFSILNWIVPPMVFLASLGVPTTCRRRWGGMSRRGDQEWSCLLFFDGFSSAGCLFLSSLHSLWLCDSTQRLRDFGMLVYADTALSFSSFMAWHPPLFWVFFSWCFLAGSLFGTHLFLSEQIFWIWGASILGGYRCFRPFPPSFPLPVFAVFLPSLLPSPLAILLLLHLASFSCI